MADELVLAVDGGQSRTLALIATLDGRVLGAGLGGPANHVHEPGGMARMTRALQEAISGAFQQAGLAADRVSSAWFGMTGGAEVVPGIVREFLVCDRLRADDDTVTALAGASLARPGVVVIAGTGAVAYGQTADGRRARSGGWGYLMGDEGSAYDLGIQALRAATQAADGRGAPTMLMDAVPGYFGAGDLHALHTLIYSGAVSRPQIAALARVVSQAAADGDGVARMLLAEAGQALARAALAVLARLEMLESGMAVYPTGGVFQAGPLLLEPFAASLRDASPCSSVRQAAFAPVVGALLLALQQAGVSISGTTIEAIRASLPAAARSKSDTE
ncbi:MAG: ATPase [Anaerolineae bacterium]|nr:ATPase [Anaerolineae bacterium]